MIRPTMLAPGRQWLWPALAASALLLVWSTASSSASLGRSVFSSSSFSSAASADSRCRSTAGNRTLGFDSIQYLNLPHRTDRSDAMLLQAYLTGIDLTAFPGVYDSDLRLVGLPPMSKKMEKMRVIACWRAHANVWAYMLQNRLPAVLVMEADAAWEMNLRPIMAEMNHHFRRLLGDVRNSNSNNNNNPPPSAAAPSADDPWMSEEWDLLSIGHCLGGRFDNGAEIKYKSRYANEGPMEWKGVTLNGERLIHRARHTICTAAYAISLRGAAKLLLRSAMNLDGPVDLIINSMAESGELVVYNVVQPPVMQWKYREGIGMEFRNSDIMDPNNVTQSEVEKKQNMENWPKAKEEHSVWLSTSFDGTGPLKENTLVNAWKHIFSDEKIDQW